MKNIFGYIKPIIRYIKNRNFREYVNNYNSPNWITFKSCGSVLKGKMVYLITLEDLNGLEQTMGFFALINCILNRLYYADRLGLLPVIKLPDTLLYYDNSFGENVFEYYFIPVSEISYSDAIQAYNLVYSEERHSQFNLCGNPGYLLSEQGIENLALIWNKYFKFNSYTSKKLEQDLLITPDDNKILGVHIRGTDFKNKNKNHPIAIHYEQYLEKIKELYTGGGYDKIFVATDEQVVITRLIEIYGNKILFYNDVLRSDNNEPVHKSSNSRTNHKYLLGYEVLRDMVTLSCCKGFIAGKSQVSLSVRIYKKSQNKIFEKCCILDNGMYM